MSGILAVKDAIRDFLRKYDEVTTPLVRFVMSLVLFWSINSMYGYSDLFERGMVVFLLSVICALVSNPVAVMLGVVIIIVNCFSVSMEVGTIATLIMLIIYGTYMRMFPKCSWVLAFVPIMYLFNIECAAPVIVTIFAGISGIIPTVFGVLLYYFSIYAKEVADMLVLAADEDEIQPFTYIVEAILKNKEMLLAMIVFAAVIMITYIIYKLPVNYSWYIAIGVCFLCTVIVYPVCGSTLGVEVNMGTVVIGALLGVVFGLVGQFCKGMVDYSRKEVVQFEDDDYYYYVKAIPKLMDPERKKRIQEKEEREKNRNGRVQSQQIDERTQNQQSVVRTHQQQSTASRVQTSAGASQSEMAMAERARLARMQQSGQAMRTQGNTQMNRVQQSTQTRGTVNNRQ